jgi:peptide deformylase
LTDAPTYPEQLITLHYPDPRLRRIASPVTVFDPALRRFCLAMLEHMYRERGVGLAAPQVGVSARIFVTDHLVSEGEPGEPRIWINPRIEEGGGESVFEEGCLSVPGLYAKVERFGHYTMIWQDESGQELRHRFAPADGDFLGTVAQHELDHLDGVLFVDHLSPIQLALLRRRLRGMEKDYQRLFGCAGAVLRR